MSHLEAHRSKSPKNRTATHSIRHLRYSMGVRVSQQPSRVKIRQRRVPHIIARCAPAQDLRSIDRSEAQQQRRRRRLRGRDATDRLRWTDLPSGKAARFRRSAQAGPFGRGQSDRRAAASSAWRLHARTEHWRPTDRSSRRAHVRSGGRQSTGSRRENARAHWT